MMIFIGEREKSEYSNREVFTRHGGAYDRGSADAYYHRSLNRIILQVRHINPLKLKK